MGKNAKPIPSQEYLREAFDYNSETGELRWRERPRSHFITESRWKFHRTRYVGRIAGGEWSCWNGRSDVKYRRVTLRLGGKAYSFAAHRVIWVWMLGEIPPEQEVDHKDVDGLNNRWSNLRLATTSENLYNQRMMSNNTTGFKGVSRYRNGFQAYINANGRRISLGNYPTAELANSERLKAASEHHGQFNRTR